MKVPQIDLSIAHRLLTKQKQQLDSYFDQLDELMQSQSFFHKYEEFVKHIMKTDTAHNKLYRQAIYFTGIGKNDTIAKKSANMLRSLNFNAHHLSPVDAMHGDMGLLNENDIIVAISRSGSTSELIHFLKYVKSFRTLTIFGIQASEKKSLFEDHCNYTIKLPEIEELDEWNKVPTSSNIVTQLFIDSAAIHGMQLCNLTLRNFVTSHPGGAIGQTIS